MQQTRRENPKRDALNKRLFIILFGMIILVLLTTICFILAFPILFKENPFQAIVATPTATSTPLPTPTPTPLPISRIAAGDMAILAGDYEQAARSFEEGLLTANTVDLQVSALNGLGQTQYLQGDYSTCLQSFGTVLASYDVKYHHIAHYYLAQCELALGNLSKTLEHLDAYTATNPGVIDDFILEQKADLLINNGQSVEALKTLETAAAATTDPGDKLRLQIRAADLDFQQQNYEKVVQTLVPLLEQAKDNYTKAHINYSLASSYFNMGLPEQAFARFQETVNNYPETVDAFNSVVFLTDHNIPVDTYARGMVNYRAGQYGLAADFFREYIQSNPEHVGAAHHYRALALRGMDANEAAIAEWQELINTHPDDALFQKAYEEIAYTQWAYLNQFDRGSQTLQDYVNRVPAASDAASLLYSAARILERNSNLPQAAAVWERMIEQYPADPMSQRGLMLAGITKLRMNDLGSALTTFQRALVLGTAREDKAAAAFWVGKIYEKLGDANAARQSYQEAADADPTGYYSERAKEILEGKKALSLEGDFNFGYDLEADKRDAENWFRYTFNVPAETVLEGAGPLAANREMLLGTAYWEIGQEKLAAQHYANARAAISGDAIANYHYINVVLPKGFYQQAIYASREILDLANLDDAGTMTAPVYFNHIRFGTYFAEIVRQAASEHNIHPIVLWSMIRQESMFTPFAGSSAGAHGALQLLPSTAQDVVNALNWPPDYTPDDLFRPVINIPLGATYYANRLKQFEGDAISALAAYNGGPGNAIIWNDLANGDPDLMLELIRFAETRTYVMQISEFAHIYERLYKTN